MNNKENENWFMSLTPEGKRAYCDSLVDESNSKLCQAFYSNQSTSLSGLELSGVKGSEIENRRALREEGLGDFAEKFKVDYDELEDAVVKSLDGEGIEEIVDCSHHGYILIRPESGEDFYVGFENDLKDLREDMLADLLDDGLVPTEHLVFGGTTSTDNRLQYNQVIADMAYNMGESELQQAEAFLKSRGREDEYKKKLSHLEETEDEFSEDYEERLRELADNGAEEMEFIAECLLVRDTCGGDSEREKVMENTNDFNEDRADAINKYAKELIECHGLDLKDVRKTFGVNIKKMAEDDIHGNHISSLDLKSNEYISILHRD